MQHPTIRTLSGATAPQAINTTKTALLVIDFQNEYFNGSLIVPDAKQAMLNANKLIQRADALGLSVFHIQHLFPSGSAVFAEDHPNSNIHPDIQPAPHHHLLQKSSVSVFATTHIDQLLKSAAIDTLIISGLMTHACVAGAARDAVPLGYNVIVAADACATRSLDLTQQPQPISHEMLHLAALASIDDTFGDIMTTDAILKLLEN